MFAVRRIQRASLKKNSLLGPAVTRTFSSDALGAAYNTKSARVVKEFHGVQAITAMARVETLQRLIWCNGMVSSVATCWSMEPSIAAIGLGIYMLLRARRTRASLILDDARSMHQLWAGIEFGQSSHSPSAAVCTTLCSTIVDTDISPK